MSIEIGKFQIKAMDAVRFAIRYDPHPSHLSGMPANEVLPKETVSGFYVVMEMVKMLVKDREYGSNIICGTGMEVRWLRPVHEQSMVRVRVTHTQIIPPVGKKTNVYRDITLHGVVEDEVVVRVKMKHIIRESTVTALKS